MVERKCEDCIFGKPIEPGDTVKFKIGIYGLQGNSRQIQRTCLTLIEAGFHKKSEFTRGASGKCVKPRCFTPRD